MTYDVINKTLWFVGLVLLQVLVLNKITMGGMATPLPYIYLLVTWNRDGVRWVLLLVGFILGLVIDTFTNLPGINAAACVLLAMMQPIYLNLFIPREQQDEHSLLPSVSTLRWEGFLKFALFCVLTHHFTLLVLEFFSVADIWGLLLRVLGCTLLTMFVILVFELLRKEGRT